MLGLAKLIALPRGPGAKVGHNQFVACLAILGLYLQLAAAAPCMAGFTAGPDLSGFPICHAPSGDQASTQKPDHPAPQHQHSCPFCAPHCHAALALPLALTFAAPAAVVVVQQALPHLAQPRLRFSIAAQPRGPPSLG